MKKIGVIINPKRTRAENTISKLALAAKQYNWELFCDDSEMADRLNSQYLKIDSFVHEVDLVLALGGDGTVLYASHVLIGSDIPVLGINLGKLGFLTAVAEKELSIALDNLENGKYQIREREGALVKFDCGNEKLSKWPALNDVVIGWGGSSRIVKLVLKINDEVVGRFSCDGIIVSTSTGSTGHALSNGGPIMHPEIHGFGISVICPHTLGSRPMVIPNSSKIEVLLERCHKSLLLSVDGQDCQTIKQGDRLLIESYKKPLKIIHLENH